MNSYPTWDALIQSIDFRGKDVADIGCGNGWFTAQFLRQAGSILALDQRANRLEQAKTTWESQPNGGGEIRFVEGDFVEYPFAPDSLDIGVLCKSY